VGRRVAAFVNTLSGRFLALTVVFVMIAEVLIFVPSVARFRLDYLAQRLEKAQLASLATLATDAAVAPALEAELLSNAGVFNVVLRRDEARQLVLASPIPGEIVATYDLRDAMPWVLMRDAIMQLFDARDRVIRVIGEPVQGAGLLIEVTAPSEPLRQAMRAYGLRVLVLSALISVVTAGLLFLAVRRLLVAPIARVADSITAYAEAPEDSRRVIVPEAGVAELRRAEEALQQMQMQLTGALRQRERLAQLGAAVAKISHDLRNILTSAQLFADRIERSDDPVVARVAPKLLGSISRAVSLCEATLAFGKAEEPPPRLTRFSLRRLVEDLLAGEGLADPGRVRAEVDVPPGLMLVADSEQLYRVLANLVRNACQAIEASRGEGGTIEIGAGEDDGGWWIRIGDTGPGLPPKARENLFTAFQGGARKGGTGLGLAIASELVRGHGGRLDLVKSDAEGTEFLIRLPKGLSAEAA
jgi:signal transduction histidine kinase